MKFSIYLLLVAFSVNLMNAQELGEYKSDVTKFGTKKFSDANSRVFISEFNVHYQIYNEIIDFKQGGKMFHKGVKGDATAEIAVGLGGVSEEALINTTDKLYKEFITTLESKGFELVGIDEASKTESYSDWSKEKGGVVRKSLVPGLVSVSPNNYDYFIERNNKGNEKKKKGPLAMIGANSHNNNLSDELNDAVVATVNLYIVFTEYGNTWSPGAAKLKIKPNLRLVDQYAIVNKKEKKGFVQFKGAQTADNVSSKISFISGKQGMNPKASFIGILKKPLEINGVVNEDKIVSYARGGMDNVGTTNAFYTIYSADSKNVKELKTLEVDGNAFADGAYLAGQKMIQEQTSSFLSSF